MNHIKIEISGHDTNLFHTEECTELDFILGISSMFDRLLPETKKMLVKKLEKLIDLQENAIIHQKRKL
ncbi:hypothetical protein LGL55_18430 [Clostridium tagluense]|uniref:hypothetical protein n=1 Tax=Clostridium tagluense TaxID=360422 RepID=UPI001CF18C02|nr:hypothetical protein [Clostridium tagluense]MCB2313247.1 hypothetical protein [Clostridium tagluense]MCB2318002.1 hypothetical protein [Clostridium tagluense]MCB2322802.1 hypothetical protein [Clostridium tagluense]MCB2327786.1 hypothetical protein [Clostridium tagluense]MCB2332433.1 hypothetical protein [Clostridium tagluense]